MAFNEVSSFAGGSTTIAPGSTITVVQPTGTNLHTVIDGGTIASISGTVGLNAGTNSIGSVVLAAGTNALGTVSLTGTSAVSGTVALSGTSAVSGTVTISGTPSVTGTVAISQTTPGTTNAIVYQATSVSTAGITPVTTLTTLESGHVLKAGAGNLYDCYVTNAGTVAGYLFVMNSTTVPANGTLGSGVIVECISVGTLDTKGISYNGGPPTVFSTGISLAFSSTAAPVLTLAATGWFNGRAV